MSLACVTNRCARPTGANMVTSPEVPRNAEDCKGKAAPGRGPQSAAKDSIGAGVLHLEHSVKILSFARIATTLLHAPLLWATILCCTRPQAREGSAHARAMLFWVLAALAVVGALAIVWVLCTYWPAAGSSSELRAGGDTLKSSPARKCRAMGRIEQTLSDEGRGSTPTYLRTFARSPTLPQEAIDVSIYDEGPGHRTKDTRARACDSIKAGAESPGPGGWYGYCTGSPLGRGFLG
jgi:hypothetical protein